MPTKFTPWLGNNVSADNCLTNDEYQTNADRLNGFQPNGVAYSKNVNSGLRLSTLVASALMSMVDDAGTYDLTSNVDDVSHAIETYFDNRQYLTGRNIYTFSNRTMSPAHANVLNDNYCFSIGSNNTLTNTDVSSSNYGVAVAIGVGNNVDNTDASNNDAAIAIGTNNQITNLNNICIGQGLESGSAQRATIIGTYNDTSDVEDMSTVIGCGFSDGSRRNALKIATQLSDDYITILQPKQITLTQDIEGTGNAGYFTDVSIYTDGVYILEFYTANYNLAYHGIVYMKHDVKFESTGDNSNRAVICSIPRDEDTVYVIEYTNQIVNTSNRLVLYVTLHQSVGGTSSVTNGIIKLTKLFAVN